MAFVAQSLVQITAYDPLLFAYQSADSPADIAASGYFNAATSRLRKGSLILVAASINGTPTPRMLVVTSATGAPTVTTAA